MWEGNGEDFRQTGQSWALSTLFFCGEESGKSCGGSLQPGGFYPTFVPGVGGETGFPPAGKVYHSPFFRLPLENLRGGFLVHAGSSSSFSSGMAQLGHQKGKEKVQEASDPGPLGPEVWRDKWIG